MNENIIDLTTQDKFNEAKVQTYLKDLHHENPETLKIWKEKLAHLISKYAKTPDPSKGQLKLCISGNLDEEQIQQIQEQSKEYFDNYKKDVEKHIMTILSEYVNDLKIISELETVN